MPDNDKTAPSVRMSDIATAEGVSTHIKTSEMTIADGDA